MKILGYTLKTVGVLLLSCGAFYSTARGRAVVKNPSVKGQNLRATGNVRAQVRQGAQFGTYQLSAEVQEGFKVLASQAETKSLVSKIQAAANKGVFNSPRNAEAKLILDLVAQAKEINNSWEISARDKAMTLLSKINQKLTSSSPNARELIGALNFALIEMKDWKSTKAFTEFKKELARNCRV